MSTGTLQPASVRARALMLARIHAAAFPPTHQWDAKAMETLMGMPGVSVLLADGATEGDAPGFIMVRTMGDEAEILTFAVMPLARRRGIGRELLARCADQAALAGVATVFLEVARDNAPAMALYRRAGFTQVGLRRNYYPDGMDACVMRREI
ncbi:ribosomal protein S18-alanine N-acetyltransferase [Komagataeibacter sp. FNDCR2]|uniref:ribosomal protein S18-alanine N-acetyltransferase n=1 Tax=Komagataeibacter sp. FNDCR2 TaxID=2878682 RepID=UPI001E64A934|nr:ribosomal protein S18-alanine N-acetyltransferase [Komagataeibacter sp. FNDCR2]MCE2575844.1 ribosomal protein S18-alanine N-acetyltransferase [Komagataeibacter sp. FNDCR2]